LEKFFEQVQSAFGFGNGVNGLSASQTVLRTILIYGITLLIVRLGSRRFLSKATAFDVVVAIMLGSVMSRGIDGSDSFIVTVLAGVALVGTHWIIGLLAYHTGWFGPLVKGGRILLIKDGQVQKVGMRKASITQRDLTQAIRMQTDHRDHTRIKRAYLERNGEISILPEEHQPYVVDVAVEDGVEKVRIEIQ
jgi:uncharacterized membrane protein YcaP (DUF421 family)